MGEKTTPVNARCWWLTLYFPYSNPIKFVDQSHSVEGVWENMTGSATRTEASIIPASVVRGLIPCRPVCTSK